MSLSERVSTSPAVTVCWLAAAPALAGKVQQCTATKKGPSDDSEEVHDKVSRILRGLPEPIANVPCGASNPLTGVFCGALRPLSCILGRSGNPLASMLDCTH